MTKHYYGLEHEWDNLILQAEDLLRDKELGTHLVGIYPTGNRIFGVKSSPPGIICLYVDSVEALLDPFANGKESYLHVNKDGSFIELVDLYQWVKQIKFPNWMRHVALLNGDIAYQEDSIDGIISCAQEYIYYAWPSIEITNTITGSFVARAALILLKTEQYLPCLTEWSIDIFPKEALNVLLPPKYTDIPAIIEDYSNGIKPTSNGHLLVDDFVKHVQQQLKEKNKSIIIPQRCTNNLTKEVIDFYRFQL